MSPRYSAYLPPVTFPFLNNADNTLQLQSVYTRSYLCLPIYMRLPSNCSAVSWRRFQSPHPPPPKKRHVDAKIYPCLINCSNTKGLDKTLSLPKIQNAETQQTSLTRCVTTRHSTNPVIATQTHAHTRTHTRAHTHTHTHTHKLIHHDFNNYQLLVCIVILLTALNKIV